MITTKTKVSGLNVLRKNLNTLTEPKFRKAALMQAGRAAMLPILNTAKVYAPVLSQSNVEKNKKLSAGTLKNDIKYRGAYNRSPKFKKNGKMKTLSQYEYVGQIKTGKATQDYAVPVEFGREEFIVLRIHAFGRKVNPYEAVMAEIKPQPFMRKSLDLHANTAVIGFANSLKTTIAQQTKKMQSALKKKGKK